MSGEKIVRCGACGEMKPVAKMQPINISGEHHYKCNRCVKGPRIDYNKLAVVCVIFLIIALMFGWI